MTPYERARREVPEGEWFWTDDTAMGLSRCPRTPSLTPTLNPMK